MKNNKERTKQKDFRKKENLGKLRTSCGFQLYFRQDRKYKPRTVVFRPL